MKNLILFFVSAAVLGAAENWPQFRGPGALGVSSHPALPEQFPGRVWASLVVWGDQVFITTVTTEGRQWEARKGLYFGGNRYQPPTGTHHWKVLCASLKTGKVQWERTALSGKPRGNIHI